MTGKQAAQAILKYSNQQLIRLKQDRNTFFRDGQLSAYRDIRRLARDLVAELEKETEKAIREIES